MHVIIKQSELTSDCWSIQFTGIEACENCEYKDTDECGGKAIIKAIESGSYPKQGIGKRVKV